MTFALVVAASVLGTLAVVLIALLIRTPNAETAREEPAAAPPADAADEDRLNVDLQRALGRYREPSEPSTAPRSAAVPQPTNGVTGSAELEELLARTLETACAIPGADGALVAVTLGREPIIGTLGLARHEADRLATTLPTAGTQTRSIAIGYEYEGDARYELPPGRIERGIAVPVAGVSAPALIAILSRAPAGELGEPQVALLEEVARRLAPALTAVVDARATRMPRAINVRELGPGMASEPLPETSADGQEGQERRQVDWLRRG